jgi:hypothetical protein
MILYSLHKEALNDKCVHLCTHDTCGVEVAYMVRLRKRYVCSIVEAEERQPNGVLDVDGSV